MLDATASVRGWYKPVRAESEVVCYTTGHQRQRMHRIGTLRFTLRSLGCSHCMLGLLIFSFFLGGGGISSRCWSTRGIRQEQMSRGKLGARGNGNGA